MVFSVELPCGCSEEKSMPCMPQLAMVLMAKKVGWDWGNSFKRPNCDQAVGSCVRQVNSKVIVIYIFHGQAGNYDRHVT